MTRRNVCPLILLSLFLTSLFSFADAADIVVVSTNADWDATLIATLQGLGHNVATPTNSEYATLDATKIATLNAADLVLVSRNTNSGDYATDAAEIADWDSITSTVWLASSYLVRSNRWSWVNTTGLQGNYTGDITAPDLASASHPLYTGMLTNGDGYFVDPATLMPNPKFLLTTNPCTDPAGNGNGIDLPGGTGVLGEIGIMGSGTAIATRNNADNPRLAAAEWDAGGTTGSGNTLGGDRFFLPLPEDYACTADPANPLINGDLGFKNVLDYLVGTPTGGNLTCDFDNDGDCDFTDINDLYAQFGAGDPSAYDLNGDTLVNGDDIGAWLAAASVPANTFNTNGATYVLGDANLDGNVNSVDLGLLLNNFNDASGLLFGDGNLNDDAFVNSVDLGLLLNNFNFMSTSSAAAVPEPGAANILGFAMALMVILSRRRRN